MCLKPTLAIAYTEHCPLFEQQVQGKEPPAGGIEEASPKRMQAGLRVEKGATLGATLNPLQPGLQTAD